MGECVDATVTESDDPGVSVQPGPSEEAPQHWVRHKPRDHLGLCKIEEHRGEHDRKAGAAGHRERWGVVEIGIDAGGVALGSAG